MRLPLRLPWSAVGFLVAEIDNGVAPIHRHKSSLPPHLWCAPLPPTRPPRGWPATFPAHEVRLNAALDGITTNSRSLSRSSNECHAVGDSVDGLCSASLQAEKTFDEQLERARQYACVESLLFGRVAGPHSIELDLLRKHLRSYRST